MHPMWESDLSRRFAYKLTVWLLQRPTGKGSSYGVRVPLGPLPANYPIAAITQSRHSEPFPSALASSTYNPRRFQILPPPPKPLFTHPDAVFTMPALAAQKAPLLALHVSTSPDAFAIGLQAPHGLFDGTAIGVILRAVQAELVGDEWVGPPVGDLNPFDAAVGRLLAREGASKARRGWGEWAAGVWVVLGLVAGLVASWWKGVEGKGAFIGDELVEGLVREVKEDVRGRGEGEYVSSEDVVKMWFVKVRRSPRLHKTENTLDADRAALCTRAPTPPSRATLIRPSSVATSASARPSPPPPAQTSHPIRTT